jgi:SNF2 family DNA or RNA helicase
MVESTTVPEGSLFALPAINLKEQRDERRRTIKERCEFVASLVADTNESALVWCHLNPEGDLLEQLIKDGRQVSGQDSDEKKEQTFLDFVNGDLRVLITKPKIGAWGLNFQHCAHVTFFPSHSYEQYYQGVRRCWRFGQKREVRVDVIATEGEQKVLKNLQRKSIAADKMFSQLVANMNDAISINRSEKFKQIEEVPQWLS